MATQALNQAPTMLTSIKGTKAVILGGTGGIGLATAQLLTNEGANIVVTSRNLDRALAAAQDLGPTAQGLALDVGSPSAIEAFFKELGPFDHLVVPAASHVLGPLVDVPTADVERLMNTKFWGQYHAVRSAAATIRKTGSVVLFSGTVTQKVMPGASAYAAVGAAVEAAGRTWAAELAPLRINTVVPGVIDTDVWDELLSPEQKAGQFDWLASVLPVGRVGKPQEVAKAVVFLLDNSFVNGVSLVVDGGHRLV